MRCPICSYEESKVVDSRSAEDGNAIRRRRECLKCKYRFTTYERLGEHPVIVIKSDGSSEAFDRQKLMRGLLIAKDLGDLVLSRLAKLDDVAYIRFASVYKDFKNIEEFSRALTDINKE